MVRHINIRQILSFATMVGILFLFVPLVESQVLRKPTVSRNSSGGPVDGATISDILSTSNFDPGDIPQSPQQEPRIESTRGQRQRMDVTAFGADPTFTDDSTVAIQKAINAACDSSLLTGGREIYFAPGAYKVSQPQAPSTAPIFSIPKNCLNLHFVGGNVAGRFAMPQFSNAPAASIVVNPGPSPNAAPMFLLENGQGSSKHGGARNSTMEQLNLTCFNQCVWIYAGGNFIFSRMNMAVSTTRMQDNTPLKISNSFWIYFYNGTLQTSSTAVPVALFVQDTPISGEQPVVGLLRFQDTVTTGGQFVFDARTNASSQSGNFVFDNVSMEMGGASGLAAVLIKDETTFGSVIGPFAFINMNVSDNVPGTSPFLETQSSRLVDITMFNSQNSFASGPAIQLDPNPNTHATGTVSNCLITGGFDSNRTVIAQSTGLPVTGCVISSGSGLDYFGNSVTATQRTDITTTGGYGSATASFAGNAGFPIRLTETAEANARIGIEPVLGLNFGPGESRGGYDARFTRSADQTLGLTFALANPPSFTSLVVKPGGSLSVGPHTYTVSSATTVANCGIQTSAFLPQTATTKSRYQTVEVNWTVPMKTSSITGYCVTRDNMRQFFVSGASTSSFTDSGTGGSTAASPTFNATFPATPQFTWSPAGFGVNNPNPKFSLDVNGTAAVNSLNVSQHLNQAAANTFAGTVALVNGTATVAFPTPYKSAPVCVANDTSAIATVRVQTTTSKLTLSQSSGADTIMYMCVGNPN
jgi:hypothetical protein